MILFKCDIAALVCFDILGPHKERILHRNSPSKVNIFHTDICKHIFLGTASFKALFTAHVAILSYIMRA